jgi:ribonuclease HII
MRYAGIDEAGYGPTLGPLAIGCAVIEGDAGLDLGQVFATTGVRDSKQLHDPKDLAPLEAVALPAIAWLTGFMPDTAADVFALFAEDAAMRQAIPWMEPAAAMALPVAATALTAWNVPGVQPRGFSGALVQPRAYNSYLRARTGNKADLEWASIGPLLARAHDHRQAQRTVIDRLGGRKFYREVLQAVFPEIMVMITEETPISSRYLLPHAEHDGHEIGFYVGGESISPLTAIASCVAKYARELHMRLLNQYWCGRMPWLKPTAGYPQDAQRWLHQIGEGYVNAWRDELTRQIFNEKSVV